MPGLKQKNTFLQVLVAGYGCSGFVRARAGMTPPCSYWSGLVCTVASMPLDIAKTRLQTMKPNADGAMPYRYHPFPCCRLIQLPLEFRGLGSRRGAAVAALISLQFGRGLLDALVKIGRNEGILAYWKGFAPYFLRLGNHTAFTFLFLEELKKLW